MEKLINHADDVERFLAGTLRPMLRPMNLAELLKKFESYAWVECRSRGITFRSEIRGEMVMNLDAELLLTALWNVLRNSCAAMSEGGVFSCIAAIGGGQALIELGDSGKGIDADPVEKVLEPFYTRGTPYGAGLGLPIARKIVELHGGDLRVSNRTDVSGGFSTDVSGGFSTDVSGGFSTDVSGGFSTDVSGGFKSSGTVVLIRLPEHRL